LFGEETLAGCGGAELDVGFEAEAEAEAEGPLDSRAILACSRGIRSTGDRSGFLRSVFRTGTESSGDESIVGGMVAAMAQATVCLRRLA
jgi:hypothetical protein